MYLEKPSVAELAERTRDLLIEMGIQPDMAWSHYLRGLLPIANLHTHYGQEMFDKDVLALHIKQIEERFTKGDISKSYYSQLRLAANRLTEMHTAGTNPSCSETLPDVPSVPGCPPSR